MASDDLDSATSALLVMDHQALLVLGYVADPAAHLARVAATIDLARAAGMMVVYVKVGFRPGYPEVSDSNMMFAGVRAGGRFIEGDPKSEIPSEIAPAPGDVVVVKHRVSAFEGTDLAVVLRSRRVETLVMFGIATSGVVLSTVRQGADLDYRLVVLDDLCSDADAEVHRFLVEKVLPRQARVVTSAAFAGLLPAAA